MGAVLPPFFIFSFSERTVVNEKISGYDAKVTEVNNLVSTVTTAESNRVQAEQNITNTFNSIVA